MLKNVKLKKALKKTIFPVLALVNKLIPKSDRYILLYSANMGIEHNLKPLKDYLVDNGYHKKYKIICGVENMKYAEDDDRVTFVPQLKAMLYFFISKHVYYTTGQIPIKPTRQQYVIMLDHGTVSYKAVGAWSNIQNGYAFYFSHFTAPSKTFAPIYQQQYLCKPENMVVNGEPVNDLFFRDYEKYDLGDYNKLGVWAPTFRQSDYLGYDDSEEDLLPMFAPEEYEELNAQLSRHNIKLIVKLHPAQSLDKYAQKKYSHLELCSSQDFQEKGYELYAMLKQSDFLVADYSSVPQQYLLLDKPIAFAIPDIDEYAERRGFVFKNVQDYMPGPKMKTKEELYAFLEDMAAGRDDYRAERARVCDIVHEYKDGNNCKRALEIGQITLP